MKEKNVRVAFALAWLVSTTVAPRAHAAEFTYDGEWLGGIVFRHGASCSGHWSPIKVHIWEKNGQKKASIDYPNDQAFDLPVAELEFSSEAMMLQRQSSSGDQFKLIGSRQREIIEGEYWENDERLGRFQIIHNTDSRLVKHQSVPDFDVELLDGDESVSKADLLGRYYLIDFWFTGCAVCLEEMPHLHDLYEKYRDKHFTILSLSIDENADLVRTFHQKRWAMPWLNAHLKESWESPLLKEFEFKGSPTLYLVSPEGRVLAANDQLLGENLQKTLAKYLD